MLWPSSGSGHLIPWPFECLKIPFLTLQRNQDGGVCQEEGQGVDSRLEADREGER